MLGKSAKINTSVARTPASRQNCVNIAVIGASGRVGRQLLELIATRPIAQRLRLVAAANSTRWLVVADGLPAVTAAETLSQSAAVSGIGLCDALLHLPKP